MSTHTCTDAVGSRKVRTVDRQRSFACPGGVNLDKCAVELRQNTSSHVSGSSCRNYSNPLKLWRRFEAFAIKTSEAREKMGRSAHTCSTHWFGVPRIVLLAPGADDAV